MYYSAKPGMEQPSLPLHLIHMPKIMVCVCVCPLPPNKTLKQEVRAGIETIFGYWKGPNSVLTEHGQVYYYRTSSVGARALHADEPWSMVQPLPAPMNQVSVTGWEKAV